MKHTRPALIGGALLLPLLLGAAAPSSPGEAYAERAAKLEGKKDAKAWLKLADFAEEQLLWKEREAALRKVLDQDPENAEAHARLDEARAWKEWLPAEEAEAREAGENQAKGLVLYGTKWVSSKEADKFREADRKEVGWDLDFRVDTPHLRIYSARPLPLTRRLARKDEDGHLHVTVSPFEKEGEAIQERLWMQLDGALNERQREVARREMPLASTFGNFGAGKRMIELWKEDGSYHYQETIRSAWGSGSSSGSGARLGPKYQRFWQE